MEIQWSLVLFAAFSLFGAGTFAAYAVLGECLGIAKGIKKAALLISLVALIVGAVSSMTHLGHLERIFGVLSNPGSGIFVEGASAGLLVVVICVLLVAYSRNASKMVTKVFSIIGIVLAVVLTIAVGTSYLMPAKPAWDVWALPFLSLSTAVLLGTLTIYALAAFEKTKGEEVSDKSLKICRNTVFGAIALQAVMTLAYVISVAVAPFGEFSRSIQRLMTADLAFYFWVAIVIIGLIVPFCITYISGKNPANGEGFSKAVSSDAPAGAEADDASAAANVGTEGSSAVVLKNKSYALFMAVICVIIAAIAFRVVMFSLGSSIISFGY